MSTLRRSSRAAFFIAFIAVQLALVLTAESRPDRIFGFRMFNESSSAKFDLFRRVRRGRRERLVPLRDGTWQARTPAGESREFHWTDSVRYTALQEPSRFVHATYGLDAQLFRLQQALDYVAQHTPDDAETLSFVAKVETLKNGRPGPRVELTSRARTVLPQ